MTNLTRQSPRKSLPYEDLFHAVIEYAPAAIALLDSQMRYIQVSQRWLSDYQLNGADIIGKYHYEVFQGASKHWKDIYRRCKTGTVHRWQEEVFQPDSGTIHSIGWEVRPWLVTAPASENPSANGKTSPVQEEMGGLLIFAEKLVSPKLQKLAENVPGMIYQFLLRTDGSVSFPFVSSGCQRIFGFKSEEIEADANLLISAIDREQRHEFETSVAISAQTLQPWKWQGRFILPSGKIVWIQGASQPKRQQNGEILWDGLLMDTTALKQAEAELQKAKEKLEMSVQERTAQLSFVITQLESEIVERKKAEVELKRSEGQLRQLLAREKLLNCLTNQIRNSLDFDTILETAVQEIQQFLQIDRCHFAWYYSDTSEPYWEVVKEARNPGLPDLTGRYEASRVGPLAQKLLKLERVRVDDVEKVEDRVWQQFVRSLGCTSILLMPMQSFKGAFGVISCSQSKEARVWRDSEVELLSAVMGQFAIALNQAELYAQTRIKADELERSLQQLKTTQALLVQTEKISSLGQLVAGVAHEVNNPVAFISGNLHHATQYSSDLLQHIQLYQQHFPNPPAEILDDAEKIDLTFLGEDLPKMLNSMQVGTERIREIMQSLRNFSRVDGAEAKPVNIHEGIDSTLMILQHRLKKQPNRPAIEIVKEYGNLPLVECYSGQLNQVFMNIIANAIDAFDEYNNGRTYTEIERFPNVMTIETCTLDENRVEIRIKNNGLGIEETLISQLFDPFFTTKPVGKGTGLGLSISYQIVTEIHKGQLKCISVPGKGTEFAIALPIVREAAPKQS